MPFSQQEITSFRHWSDRVFSFTTTRPEAFEFRNGEFVMLGLRPEGKLIPRAYSITSTNRDDHLEFLSIRVPDGPLTSHLARVGAGAPIWINSKSTGSLTLEHIRPGRNLYMLATGTGLAPFLSLIRAGEVFRCFQRVILVHTVRARHDLAYHDELWSRTNERFRYLPTVTREPFATDRQGAELFRDGELAAILDLPPAEPDEDRVMVCGNPDMNREMAEYLKDRGWTMADYRGAGQFAVELAFVQQS
jgi:ferredoxin--NADP+ reductase